MDRQPRERHKKKRSKQDPICVDDGKERGGKVKSDQAVDTLSQAFGAVGMEPGNMSKDVQRGGKETSELGHDVDKRSQACSAKTHSESDEVSDEEKRRVEEIGDELKRKALTNCHCTFIENLDPVGVLAIFKQGGIFKPVKVRNMQEKPNTSAKNKAVLDAIESDPSKYMVFKTALVQTGQVKLVKILEDEERSLHSKLLGARKCVCEESESCPVLQSLICSQNIDHIPSISELKPEEFKRFSRAVGDFNDGNYVLMVSPTKPIPHLALLGKVPWVLIFDYDTASRSDGVMAYVEETLESQQSVHVLSVQDDVNFSDNTANWVFMLGINDRPDTLIKTSIKEWKEKVHKPFISLIGKLEGWAEGYTELTVVAIWPDDKEQQRYMKYTLSKLEDSRVCPSIVVLCNEQHTESQLPSEDNHSNLTIITFTLKDICSAINDICGNFDSADCERRHRLPTSDKTNNPNIGIKDANTLKEDLAVLYLDNEAGKELEFEDIQAERDNFYRGGTLPWTFWYSFMSGGGHIDIERDIKRTITSYIKDKHISTWKSGTITLYHFPGAGGTTLAQRVLWDLKDTVPCAQVLHRADSDLLVDKVQLLCERTQLPVILLMDGEDEHRFETIQKQLKNFSCVIYFKIRRCTSKPTLQKGDFYLESKVSEREANVLCSLYLDQCKILEKGPTFENKIRKIAKKVKRGIEHSIIDFGLVLHDYQYEGIRSYVESFMLLNEDDSQELFPWQRALLMLSLAQYYGQTSVPCQLFSRILKPKHKGRRVLYFDNIPEEMKEFVVEGTNEKNPNVIRISHYVIAKEIIDQLLTQNRNSAFWERPLQPTLHRDAKLRIEPVAIAFIKEIGYISNNTSTDSVIKMLIRIFIYRDNETEREEEVRSKKKQFSRLLEDVSSHSPYNERFTILQQLTDSFPKEAEFLAHLGRLYAKCRPEMVTEAEQCFENALCICEDYPYRNGTKEATRRRLSLRKIYHMYGNMFLSRVIKYTGKYIDDMPVEPSNTSDMPFVLGNIKHACDNFRKNREVTPSGYETSYGYIDEIRARLLFCEFAYKNKGCVSIHELAKTDTTDVGIFVRDCYIMLEELFADCIYSIDPSSKDEKEIEKLQAMHSVVFKSEREALSYLTAHDGIDAWKMKIVLLKMKNGIHNAAGALESLENGEDIEEIILNIEKIIDEYLNNEDESNRRQADIYFRQWLSAIRHNQLQRSYPIAKVLRNVEMWYNKFQTQTARFYLFILKSLYGFGSVTSHGNVELLVESQRLKDDVTRFSKSFQKPKYPREWLGQNENSFNRVVSGFKFGRIDSRKVQEYQELEILKGTICPENDRPLAGYISLDGVSRRVSVKVFFVPAKSKMLGVGFKGRRVEFVLGFSMSHGYEAFNVKELESATCRNIRCRKRLEFRSCDEAVLCTGCNEWLVKSNRN